MITPDFWNKLTALRACSRSILAALEDGDFDRLERLSRESEENLAELRPVIEARMADVNRTEEDELLAEMLRDLKTMNDRIVEELALGARAVQEELGELRGNRLRLVQYRDSAMAAEPALVDRDG